MKLTTLFVALAAATASAQAFGFGSHHDSQHLESRSNPTEQHSTQQLARRSHPSHHVAHDEQTLSRRSKSHHQHQSEEQEANLATRSEDVFLELSTREIVEELEARLDIERRGKKINWLKKKLGLGGHGGQQQQQPSGTGVDDTSAMEPGTY